MADGITVIDQHSKLGHTRCKHWLFRVWDDRRGTWGPSKAFDTKAPGWVWAEKTRSELGLGLVLSGTLPFAPVAEDYAKSLDNRSLRDVHVAEVRRVCAAAAVVAPDLNDQRFPEQVATWLANAKTFAKGREVPLSNVTKNRWLRHLKSACLHAVRHHGLRASPLQAVKPLKVDDTLKTTLRIDELTMLVRDNFPADPYYLAACLMIYAGLRVGEALHCRWEWVDVHARTISVRVRAEYRLKRNKERVVPLLDELRDILWRWPGRKASGWIVADDRLRAGGNRERWEAFRAYCANSGVEPRDLHPHATRHTWIALMLATGVSVTRVRRAAGHTRTSTTDVYAEHEAQYEEAVRTWTRGQFFLRRRPPAEALADPLGVLREHVNAGRDSVDELAAAAEVPAATLTQWLEAGPPEPIRQLAALHRAMARVR